MFRIINTPIWTKYNFQIKIKALSPEGGQDTPVQLSKTKMISYCEQLSAILWIDSTHR